MFEFNDVNAFLCQGMFIQNVEKLVFKKNKQYLVHIMTGNVLAIKVHYRQGIGDFLCFGEECCDVEGSPRIRYILPVIVYDTLDNMEIVSHVVKNYALCLGPDVYEDLITLQKLNGKIEDIDILITCRDEEFQKVSFQYAGQARLNTPEFAQEKEKTIAFWQNNYHNIIKPVAKAITRRQYLDYIKKSIALTEDSKESSKKGPFFEDVFRDLFKL